MTRKNWLLLILMFAGLPIVAHAQLWSGVLDPSRAVDWSKAGVVGGIQNRTTICSTLSPGATAAQINSAISSCPSGQVVKLNAGTYNLSTGINLKSNVTLRGSGADQTKLIFSNSGSCVGLSSDVCIGVNALSSLAQGGNPSAATTTFSCSSDPCPVGTTTITVGSASALSVGRVLLLDQLDDSSDGYPSAGDIYVCSNSTCSEKGGNDFGRNNRSQVEMVTVTGISGNQVTFTPGLRMPNWRAAKSPGMSFGDNGRIVGAGLEDLSMDHQNGIGPCTQSCGGVIMIGASNSWVKGVRSLLSGRNHVWLYQTNNSTVRDSYFFGSLTSASTSYGIETSQAADLLIENNIFQHITAPLVLDGAEVGSVWSYNFTIDDSYDAGGTDPAWMQPTVTLHEPGESMLLFEGNSGLGFGGDDVHGTHHFVTLFRNHWYGDVFNNPVKSQNTTLVHVWAYNRFFNIVGNVLGRTGYYNIYEDNLGSNATDVYSFGEPDTQPTSDPRAKATSMRWGNYDTVNGAARFVAAEVPSGITHYANPVPGSNALPNSFYLNSKPAFFGSTPWPPIGPDVSGGNETIAGTAGHANIIPSKACYNSSGTDSAYGTSNVRLFNAARCYGGGAPAPNPPTAVQVVVH